MSDPIEQAIAAAAEPQPEQRIDATIGLQGGRQARLNVPVPLLPDDYARIGLALASLFGNSIEQAAAAAPPKPRLFVP